MKLNEILKEVGDADSASMDFEVMVQKEDKIYMVDDVIVKYENGTIYFIIG